MAKMRVHELAKELDIKSQDIIDTLAGTEYEVKAASSGIDDAAQDIVRKKYTKAAPKPVEKPVEKAVEKQAEKKPQEKPTAPVRQGEAPSEAPRPKKKASITAVFNAQYSKQAPNRRPNQQGNGKGRPNSGRPGERPAGDGGRRRENGQVAARPENKIIRPRPVGERAMRPISERTANNVDDFAMETKKDTPVSTETRVERPQNQERPNGDRPVRNDRGERQERQDRPKYTDRPQRPRQEQDRPSNNKFQSSDRQGRGNGDRPARTNGDRPNQDRKGNRFDREMDRFNKEAAPVEEVRGKESRERGGNDRKNNNRHQDHDKLGSKRQENYVNLEKHGGKKKPQQQPQQPKEDENEIKTITLPEKLTIKELADAMKLQPSAIVKKLFLKGQMVTVNQEVSFEEAEEIALEFNYICEAEEKVDVIAELLKEDEENEEDMVSRPPVVCVMGHVDHGKTSLLDAIRSTRVTDREAGGITQHIGASVVSINNQNITFLDTPGHEAFTAMRMRGANSTDIAILVVAADDGVMPQTVEAINHAKAAGVEIIVAINKIDKPSANIDKVKQELSEYELIPEDWGGSTIFCPVSAHTKEGIDNLLEMVLLTAEVLELKANPKRNARGLVIEAQLDKGRGAVATMLVQKGTLHVGDPIACGSSYGKIRAMVDDKGRRVKEATPSTPVEILGLNSVPAAGETFVCCDSEKDAKAFAEN